MFRQSTVVQHARRKCQQRSLVDDTSLGLKLAQVLGQLSSDLRLTSRAFESSDSLGSNRKRGKYSQKWWMSN